MAELTGISLAHYQCLEPGQITNPPLPTTTDRAFRSPSRAAHEGRLEPAHVLSLPPTATRAATPSVRRWRLGDAVVAASPHTKTRPGTQLHPSAVYTCATVVLWLDRVDDGRGRRRSRARSSQRALLPRRPAHASHALRSMTRHGPPFARCAARRRRASGSGSSSRRTCAGLGARLALTTRSPPSATKWMHSRHCSSRAGARFVPTSPRS